MSNSPPGSRTDTLTELHSAYAPVMASGTLLPAGTEDDPYLVGSRRPPVEPRPEDSRRRVIGRVSSSSFREVWRLAVERLTGWRRIQVTIQSAGALLATGVVYAAGPVAGAFIAAGGSALDIAVGSVTGLLTQPAGLYVWARRYWTRAIAGALMHDRVLFPFPGDWCLTLWLEEADAPQVVAVLEDLGFWNVQAWRFARPNDRWTVTLRALSNVAAGDSRNGRVVDALNAQQIPFAGFSSSPAMI